MFQLSARIIMILAVVCFVGAVAMQVWWMRSAYQGELASYNKHKSQFELHMQEKLKQNSEVKQQLMMFLGRGNQNDKFSEQEKKKLIASFNKEIQELLNEKQYDLDVKNFGIAWHKHGKNSLHRFEPIVFINENDNSPEKLENAGRVCLYCLLDNKNLKHEEFSYDLLFLYGNEQLTIYKKMGYLIIGSLLFLFLLALLFRLMMKKYQQEKKLSEAKNDFINNLSHEIQTPVFAVQMANKLIKEKAVQQEELEPLVSVIEKETLQLKHHAAKILELASLENEQPNLNLELVELNSFIEKKTDTLHVMLHSKHGKLETNYASKELHAELDTTHFNNVLVSLTENSIKYNNGIPKVCIETGEKDDMIFLRVKDNGIEIDPKYLPFVFDKFYRVPTANRHAIKGFGLGLSYVRQIIKLHNGSVEIQSGKGTGTIVTVLLPKANSHA